jgi:phosphoglycerol transferase MdoB-like AlkP superfamily enzyme
MDLAKPLLLVLAVACALLALLLRRRRQVIQPWVWVVVEAAPVLLTWTASALAVWLFTSLAHISQKSTFVPLAVSSGALLAIPVALCPPVVRARAGGALLVFFTFLLLGDLIHYRFFGSIVPLLAVGSAALVWDAKDSVAALVEPRDAWLLSLSAIAFGFLVLWPLAPREARSSRRTSAVSVLLLTGVCIGGALPVVTNVADYVGKSRSWKVMSVAGNLAHGGIVLAHTRDVAVAWRERKIATVLQEDQRAQVDAFARAHAAEARRLHSHPSFGALAGTNVIFVQLEAIQEWLIDADVSDVPAMPFLRALKERSLYFPNIYDQTGGSPTSDCEYLVLNGLHPLERGAVSFRRAGNKFVALPTLLADQGYQTVSVHAYHRGMWNRGVLHPRWGFQTSYFREDMPVTEKMGWGIGDKPFFGRAVDVALEQRQPFFQFLITLTSHHPYRYVPKEQWSVDVKGVPSPLSHYLRSARYVDEAVEELFARLEESGLLSNTTVVLYGDHDAKLKYNNAVAKKAASALNVDVATLQRLGRRDWAVDRVPLLIVPPRGSKVPSAVVSTVGGQIDIGPTVLHYLGVSAPPSFLGLPLLAERAGWVARFDNAAVDSERLLRPGKRARCERSPRMTKKGSLPRCDDLAARAALQTEVSALITMHDLASGLPAFGE